jgi:hypothetical protein
LPFEVAGFEQKNIIKPEITGVVTSEYEKTVATDGAGSVIGSFEGLGLSTALYKSPLYIFLNGFDSVNLVVGVQFSTFFVCEV